MKFKEARDKLKKLANGRYHSISYNLTDFGNGTQEQETECRLYIDQGGGVNAPTFETCFELLENKIEEMPETEEVNHEKRTRGV